MRPSRENPKPERSRGLHAALSPWICYLNSSYQPSLIKGYRPFLLQTVLSKRRRADTPGHPSEPSSGQRRSRGSRCYRLAPAITSGVSPECLGPGWQGRHVHTCQGDAIGMPSRSVTLTHFPWTPGGHALDQSASQQSCKSAAPGFAWGTVRPL